MPRPVHWSVFRVKPSISLGDPGQLLYLSAGSPQTHHTQVRGPACRFSLGPAPAWLPCTCATMQSTGDDATVEESACLVPAWRPVPTLSNLH